MLQKVEICGVDTAGLPVLTAEESAELMKKLKAGDAAAREKFIVGNMRLVLSLVKRFWAKNANADDVFQAGCIGLLKAIDNFDLSVGVRFSTYAVPNTLERGNRTKEACMIRKEAISAAISALQGNFAAVEKLREVEAEMPFVRWTEKGLCDCVEQFMEEQGRLPTLTDCGRRAPMPSHATIAYVCKMPASAWLHEKFPRPYLPQMTRRRALQLAVRAVEGEAKAKLQELAAELPFTGWNESNIRDGLERFLREYGRLPQKRDYIHCRYLPGIDVFRRQYRMSRTGWIQQYCPDLTAAVADGARKKRDSLQDFVAEYLRIAPCSKREFDQKRDAARYCTAEVVMRRNSVRSWKDLLRRCGLEAVPPPAFSSALPREAKIDSVITIIF